MFSIQLRQLLKKSKTSTPVQNVSRLPEDRPQIGSNQPSAIVFNICMCDTQRVKHLTTLSSTSLVYILINPSLYSVRYIRTLLFNREPWTYVQRSCVTSVNIFYFNGMFYNLEN